MPQINLNANVTVKAVNDLELRPEELEHFGLCVVETLVYLLSTLNDMLDTIEYRPDKLELFDHLRETCVSIVNSTHLDGEKMFVGAAYRAYAKLTDRTFKNSIKIPDLQHFFTYFKSNITQISGSDVDAFADRIRNKEISIVSPSATICAVKLTSFVPRTVVSSKILAINSIADMSGVYAMSFGNAIIGKVNSRNTQMPLLAGQISLNGISLHPSNGTVEDLVKVINQQFAPRGLYASGVQGQKIVLINYTGGSIQVNIRNQSAALVSGFPVGSCSMSSGENGLIVWLSSEAIDSVNFDCKGTALSLTGQTFTKIPLQPFLFNELNINNSANLRLSWYLIKNIKNNIDLMLSQLKIDLKNLNVSSLTN